MRNIALKLMYNGTAYHGWQVQKTEVTVAEAQVTIAEDERQECIQVAEEGNNEEKNVDTKETFLNRFIRKLGDIMESVE